MTASTTSTPAPDAQNPAEARPTSQPDTQISLSWLGPILGHECEVDSVAELAVAGFAALERELQLIEGSLLDRDRQLEQLGEHAAGAHIRVFMARTADRVSWAKAKAQALGELIDTLESQRQSAEVTP